MTAPADFPGPPAGKMPDPEKVLNLSKVLLAAFLLVGVGLLYWGVWRAPAILARVDNPRLVEAARRVARGSILDRDGRVLAADEGPVPDQVRRYAAAAGHATGFSSLRFGAGGAEAAFDAALRGAVDSPWTELQRAWQHAIPQGANVRLELDAVLQTRAADLLNGRSGAALLLEMPHATPGRANTVALASSPGYDANLLNEQFETLAVDEDAPLLNRGTQGQYQPGLLLQPLILAYAVDQGLIRLNDPVPGADRIVPVNGSTLRCREAPPDPATWADVLRLRCPAPMQDLASRLGKTGLDEAFSAFGLTRDPAFELDTSTSAENLLSDPVSAAIGQENLSITPLQVGLALAALAGSGELPVPQVGAALITSEGQEEVLPAPGAPSTAVGARAAAAVYAALPRSDGYTALSPVVISGPEGRANAWFAGHWAGETADYVAVIVLENSADEAAAQAAGRALLDAARVE